MACRVYGVRQLVECMILNMGRIRLVLSRIWAIVAPHLVSAACAPDERVAKYAVEALQRLIDRLLLRAELANFTYQVRCWLRSGLRAVCCCVCDACTSVCCYWPIHVCTVPKASHGNRCVRCFLCVMLLVCDA